MKKTVLTLSLAVTAQIIVMNRSEGNSNWFKDLAEENIAERKRAKEAAASSQQAPSSVTGNPDIDAAFLRFSDVRQHPENYDEETRLLAGMVLPSLSWLPSGLAIAGVKWTQQDNLRDFMSGKLPRNYPRTPEEYNRWFDTLSESARDKVLTVVQFQRDLGLTFPLVAEADADDVIDRQFDLQAFRRYPFTTNADFEAALQQLPTAQAKAWRERVAAGRQNRKDNPIMIGRLQLAVNGVAYNQPYQAADGSQATLALEIGRPRLNSLRRPSYWLDVSDGGILPNASLGPVPNANGPMRSIAPSRPEAVPVEQRDSMQGHRWTPTSTELVEGLTLNQEFLDRSGKPHAFHTGIGARTVFLIGDTWRRIEQQFPPPAQKTPVRPPARPSSPSNSSVMRHYHPRSS